MQHGGHFSPSAAWCLCSVPAPSLPLAGASQTLVFSYLPLAPSSPNAAPLQSSTLNAIFWSMGEGFAWERHGKVKSTALLQQLRAQKSSCATTETLGARPGIYTVICIRVLTRRSFQHRSLGDNISFLTIPALTSARELGLHKGIVR